MNARSPRTHRAPRLGLGRGRIEPDRARFVSAAQLIQYLCDYLELDQREVADRCDVHRVQISRWITGAVEPSLGRLRAALQPLGWYPVLTLRPTEAALDQWLDRPLDLDGLLGWYVLDLLVTVAEAVARGLDVVVGGEVAAVVQGVPLSTRRMTVVVREEHRGKFVELLRARRLWVGHPLLHATDAEQADGEDPDQAIESGPIRARLHVAGSRPPSRVVRVDHPGLRERDLPVVTLQALLDADHEDPVGLGQAARDAAGRLRDRVGRADGGTH